MYSVRKTYILFAYVYIFLYCKIINYCTSDQHGYYKIQLKPKLLSIQEKLDTTNMVDAI